MLFSSIISYTWSFLLISLSLTFDVLTFCFFWEFEPDLLSSMEHSSGVIEENLHDFFERLFLFREKLELIELLDFSEKFDFPKWIKKYFFARQQISFDSVNRRLSWNWYNPWFRKKLTNWKKNSWKKRNFMKYPWYLNMRRIIKFSL